METTKIINQISERVHKWIKRFLYVLVIGIGVLFILLSCFVFIAAGLLASNSVDNPVIINNLILALLICGGFVFLSSTLSISVVLNVSVSISWI